MSKIILPELTDNLEGLKTHEDKIRIDSTLTINSQQSLQDHINLIHNSMDMLMWMYRRSANLDSNKLVALTGLRVRLFNSTSCSLKLLLNGYYQGSVSFIRDILELSFLLDYFTLENSAIDRWVINPDGGEFKPVKIRSALDKRDGLSDQKRKQIYKLLCVYGTHATFDGNRLFSNNNLLEIGPFFNQKFLQEILFELALSLPHPVLTCLKFESHLKIDDLWIKKDFFSTIQSWWKANINNNFPDVGVDEIQEIFDLFGFKGLH